MKRGLIVTGGRRPSRDLLEREIQWADGIICADGGYDALAHVPEKLKLVIGDFDSSHRLEELKAKKLPIEILPPEKDETDTEMSVLRMLEFSPDEIHILGATGSRWDHSVATIFSMEAYLNEKSKISLIDDNNRLRMIPAGTYDVKQDDFRYVSLIPVTDAVVISTKGFKYEVDHLRLYRKKTRGVSNELLQNEGTVTLHEGTALLIQSKDE